MNKRTEYNLKAGLITSVALTIGTLRTTWVGGKAFYKDARDQVKYIEVPAWKDAITALKNDINLM